MDAGKKKINDILNGNRQLVIPFFQRSYVWKEDLWERFIESMELVSQTGKEYFLGSVILKQLPTSTSSTVGDVRTVIDGQQRLTTLALFLKVLCFKTGKRRKFENMFILDDDKFAIVHNMFDKVIFDEIIAQENLAYVNSESRLAQAYQFFLDNLDVEKFNLDTILAHISFVGIDLNNEDDEQVIFDTINSIGVTLTTGELLKNYLFSQDSIHIYLSKWKPVFEADEETLKYWDSNVTQVRKIRKNLETFLNAYLHIKINDPAYGFDSVKKERFNRVEDLFSQYKDFISMTGIDYNILVDDLTEYAQIYRHHLSPRVLNEEISSKYGLERLNLIIFGLDTTTLMPYLLYVLKNQNNQEEIDKIARILESYLMRRLVCKRSTNNYSDLFSQSLIGAQFLTAQSLKEYLSSKENDSSLAMPGDEEFIYAFEDNVLLDIRSKGVLYLLESKIRSSRHSTSLKSFNSYTLEHLMPKKWKPETWPIADPTQTESRNLKLKTLGNLSILPQTLNSSISNNSWNIKLNGNTKKKGLKEYATGLDTMSFVLSQTDWNESKIEARADWLFDNARVIWNFEDVEFESNSNEVHEIEEDNVSAEPDDSFITMVTASNSEVIRKKVNSNNDRTKFSLDGGRTFLSKNRFVLNGIQQYVNMFPKKTLSELKAVFKDSLLKQFKRLGFICSEVDLQKPLTRGRKPTDAEISRWYFLEDTAWMTSGDGIRFTVSTQITLDSANAVREILEAEGIMVSTTK
ncbi:MAG: DUF262 domain-containing protein [Bacteroides sp.]|nr:DUF262 domain-containing protein [Bacteroides sp.]